MFRLNRQAAWGYSGDNGPATSAQLDWPAGVAVDAAGNLFIADYNNDVIREVNHATGVITTVAGENGNWGYSGDGGPATSAELGGPTAVAVDFAGDLFITDYSNCAVREVQAGVISTVAGGNGWNYGGDGGPATSAELAGPMGVAVDTGGDLFIADTGNDVIREVNATGVISTFAGTCWQWGYSGDGGPATSADLATPMGLAVDAAGNLFISDMGNNVIRQVDQATGLITTVAGQPGSSGYAGDGGPAAGALLCSPLGLASDAAGDLFIADEGNGVVREVTNEALPTVSLSGDEHPATEQAASISATFPADATGEATFYNGSTPLGTARLGPAPSSALQFDGVSGYMSTDCLENAVTAYSVSAWVNTSDASDREVILGDRGMNGNGDSLTLGLGQTGLSTGASGDVFFVLDSNGVSVGKITKAKINDGNWHHIVGTWAAAAGTEVTPGQFEIYIDGVLQTSFLTDNGTTFGPIVSPLTGVGGSQVGQSSAWGTSFLNGSLYELLVFDRALSQSDVDTLYGGGQGYYGTTASGPCASGLVAGYHFDDEGQYATDFSGNGHTGTLYGGFAWLPSGGAVSRPGVSYATIMTAFAAAGSYNITVAYSGDANYASTSAAFAVAAHAPAGQVYYVDPMGLGGTPSDSNPGTLTQPLATYYHARDIAQPGDTIVLRGGLYNMLDPSQVGSESHNNLNLTLTSGQAGAPITYTNYPGETPVLDFSEQEPDYSAQNPGGWQWDPTHTWCWAVLPQDSIVAQYGGPVYVYRTDVPSEDCQLAARVASYGDFVSPPSQFLTGDQRAYDLSYYDDSNPLCPTIYWRPAAASLSPPLDVAQDLKLVSDNSGPGVPATYITMQGLTFQFGQKITATGDHFAFIDNTVTNFYSQGIGGGGNHWLLQGNYIDRISGVWQGSNGNYTRKNQDHCIYLEGQNFTFQDNFIGRSFSGYSVQILDNGATENFVFEDNVVYAGDFNAAIYIQGSYFDFRNNVIIAPNNGPALELYGNVDGLTFSNNYVETSSSSNSADIDTYFATDVQNFQIDDNVLNSGNYGLDLVNGVDLTGAGTTHDISGNQWISSNSQSPGYFVWNIWVNGMPTREEFTSYAAYENYVSQQFGWQDTSFTPNSTATVNQPVVTQLLDITDPLQAYSYLWQYAEALGFTS